MTELLILFLFKTKQPQTKKPEDLSIYLLGDSDLLVAVQSPVVGLDEDGVTSAARATQIQLDVPGPLVQRSGALHRRFRKGEDLGPTPAASLGPQVR